MSERCSNPHCPNCRHWDVKAIAREFGSAVLKCEKCGHEYKSKSRSAMRVLHNWEWQKEWFAAPSNEKPEKPR